MVLAATALDFNVAAVNVEAEDFCDKKSISSISLCSNISPN